MKKSQAIQMVSEIGQQPPLILIVDDDSSTRRFYTQVLQRHQFVVHEAFDGEKALRLIAETPYDLILTDLQMPGISGLEVLKASKQKDPHCPVLVLTGFGSVPSAVKAMKNGAYEYLGKPITQDSLVMRVKKALEHRKMALLLESQKRALDDFHLLIERDLELARMVQASMMPENLYTSNLSVAIEYRQMLGFGGDFADIYQDAEGFVHLSIMDVTGHGITAALIVNRICSEIRKLVREGLQPSSVLFHLNNFFCDAFAKTGLYLTIMTMRVDPKNHQIDYAGAAHPAALLVHPGGKVIQRLHSQNVIIGFEKTRPEQFQQNGIKTHPNDRLLLYTDGLIEAENDEHEPLGIEGLEYLLRKQASKAVVPASKSIIRYALNHANDRVRDDILLMLVELSG